MPDERRQDARGYSWPPFEPGNTLAVKHGARSDRLVQARAVEISPLVFDANPHLEHLRDFEGIQRQVGYS